MANLGNILIKSIGVIGLGLVAYDSHSSAKYTATMHTGKTQSEDLQKRYFRTLHEGGDSSIKSATKKRVFQYYMDQDITSFFSSVVGYVKGFASTLVNNVVPFGLALGTVLARGIASKLFGAGLLTYGGIFLLQEFFGIGKHKG
ncbi:MAG: hypothetical protein PHC64_10455 [Candidatus Gastranaerophilales bacterium]|nr:hypothetical protein [Candidatus Gastranaerophilales bacterium]